MDQVFNAVKKKISMNVSILGVFYRTVGASALVNLLLLSIICKIKLLRGFFCCSHSSGTSRSFTDVMLVCTSVFVWT